MLPIHVQQFVNPWNETGQASLSLTISQSLPKFMSIELVMPSNHLILCHPLLLQEKRQQLPTRRPLQVSAASEESFFGHKGLAQHIQRDESKKNLQPRLLYPGKPYCNHSVMSLHTCHNGYHEKDNIKCCQRCEEKRIFVHCWQGCKQAELLWKRGQSFL